MSSLGRGNLGESIQEDLNKNLKLNIPGLPRSLRSLAMTMLFLGFTNHVPMHFAFVAALMRLMGLRLMGMVVVSLEEFRPLFLLLHVLVDLLE